MVHVWQSDNITMHKLGIYYTHTYKSHCLQDIIHSFHVTCPERRPGQLWLCAVMQPACSCMYATWCACRLCLQAFCVLESWNVPLSTLMQMQVLHLCVRCLCARHLCCVCVCTGTGCRPFQVAHVRVLWVSGESHLLIRGSCTSAVMPYTRTWCHPVEHCSIWLTWPCLNTQDSHSTTVRGLCDTLGANTKGVTWYIATGKS